MLPVSKAPAVAPSTTSFPGSQHSHVTQEADDAAGPSTSTSSSGVTQEADNAGLSPVEVESSTPMPSTTPGSLSTPPLDPADWPTVINDKVRIDLVSRGPAHVDHHFTFPKRQSDNRRFHYHFMFRSLTNGEKVKRSWLTYSQKSNAVYCFCCKLFSKQSTKLSTDGQQDWINIGTLLKQHENSQDHAKNVLSWKELEGRLRKGETIDQTELSLLEAERNRWREVLIRLVSIIQSLAERNMGLRGSVDTLHVNNNGNFLKEVELLAKFDPVLKEHVRRIDSGANHTTYLGKTVQNELIACISDTILRTIVVQIKESKYFSLILDCTPDVSHQEQMSVVIRTVDLKNTPEIREHFLGFLLAHESTGLGLSTLILRRLEELNIPFEDCRGQTYDNGANMKGRNKGTQARLLKKNPRALYVPCAAHTLNLMVADSAKGSVDATNFFGVVQKLYTLFAAASQRWAILKDHVDLTVKAWSETRWESRINSIEPLRYHTVKVREALLEVREKTNDPMIRIEAQSLAEEIGSFRFQICTVVWYDILSKINTVSKLLQSVNMQLDIA
uniref:TTF-type domain-containing protein n=1 Tax=Cyprinus carpio TaxID=7962 RepID=A0A8C1J990_CYPCA